MVAVFAAKGMNIAWPWFAPIGTLVFLVVGLTASYKWGEVTPEQLDFIHKQKHLIAKPKASHYGLFAFAAFTVVICIYIPDWLGSVLL